MLKKSFISFAIIVSGLFLANQAYGQSSIKSSMNRGSQTQSINSPRDVATGQLIDTSTGEIVWADEVKKNRTRSTQFTGSDEELGALIAWLRANRPTTSALNAGGTILGDDVRSSGSLKNRGRVRGLIDTSTGEIVW